MHTVHIKQEKLQQRVTQSDGLELWPIRRYHLQQRTIPLFRSGRSKENGFRLPRVANCREINIWGETNRERFIFRFL